MEGYGLALEGARPKLALARGDLAEAERLVSAHYDRRRPWFFASAITTRLDALSDEAFLRRALKGFEAIGLEWHAEQTRTLITQL